MVEYTENESPNNLYNMTIQEKKQNKTKTKIVTAENYIIVK